MRFKNYLEQKIQTERSHGRTANYTLKLTPGQYAELAHDLGRDPAEGFVSCNGVHPVEKLDCHTQATGDNVILCPREDLFAEVERDTGIELVSLANSVTSVPDNVGCCEVVSVGELVTNVRPGDIAFIDFFDVKQGYVLANEDHYVAGSDAFKGRFDPIKQEVLPLDNYVVTRRASDRMKVALNGTDRIHVLDYILTDGIVSGRTSSGAEATHTLYQEVVSVGKLTARPRPGVMTRAERELLDAVVYGWGPNEELIEQIQEERKGRLSDIKPGDLVAFCKEIGVPLRVRGEFQYLIPYNNVLAVIDDAAILEDAVRAGRAGKIALVA